MQWKCSFAPVCAPDAEFLILGSLPGEESLRRQEYYAFRYNAFWRIIEDLGIVARTRPYEERLAALRRSGIALWDTVERAVRPGSLDSRIAGMTPNDIPRLLRECPQIRKIGCNGSTSFQYLNRFFGTLSERMTLVRLPSTSPAAASIPYAVKLAAYRDFLEKGDGVKC